MNQTFVMIKPDARERGLVGEVISRFEKKCFRIVNMRIHCVTLQEAEELYAYHKGKDFYDRLIKFTSGPVVVMILDRVNDAVDVARLLIGASGLKGAPGTIRGDFADWGHRNIVHVSDSKEAFLRESAIFFPQAEEALTGKKPNFSPKPVSSEEKPKPPPNREVRDGVPVAGISEEFPLPLGEPFSGRSTIIFGVAFAIAICLFCLFF